MNKVLWEAPQPIKKPIKTKADMLRRKQEDNRLFNEIAYQEDLLRK